MADKGWAMLGDARKFHYYDGDLRSICGRYAALFVPSEAFEPETDKRSSQECAGCRRRLDKRGVK